MLSVPSSSTPTREEEFTPERSLLPATTTLQETYEFRSYQHLGPDISIDTQPMFLHEDYALRLKDNLEKIRSYGFLLNYPWLPPNALRLLNRAKKGSLSEKELVTLMELVAERASIHFQMTEGKFVALTFHGRVVEVSDTRVDLLKKLQSRKHQEQIFVWRIGSNAFSGRL